MSRWFRIYDDVLDDPKVQRLSGDLFKTWMNLLCLASKQGGILPPVDDIAFRLRISARDAQQRIEDLILAGLVDIRPDGKQEPHNWPSRQMPSDSSTERSRKHRDKKRNATATLQQRECNGLEEIREEIEPEPEEETDSEPDQTRDAREGMGVLNEILSGSVGAQADSKISVEAKRTVCSDLGLADCEEIVRRFLAWPNRQPPRKSIDAQFIASAKKIFDGMPDHMRAKLSLEEPEPQRMPPVKASSSLKQLIRD